MSGLDQWYWLNYFKYIYQIDTISYHLALIIFFLVTYFCLREWKHFMNYLSTLLNLSVLQGEYEREPADSSRYLLFFLLFFVVVALVLLRSFSIEFWPQLHHHLMGMSDILLYFEKISSCQGEKMGTKLKVIKNVYFSCWKE